jgi:hypothetical protein
VAKSPGPSSTTSSPSWTVRMPSTTKKESSMFVWCCKGGPAPYAGLSMTR